MKKITLTFAALVAALVDLVAVVVVAAAAAAVTMIYLLFNSFAKLCFIDSLLQIEWGTSARDGLSLTK